MADISKIKASNGTTYNLKDIEGRKEENLVWGGPSQQNNVSPVGMALSNEHSANRLAFINGNALTFEYSSNGGSTWTTYSFTTAQKTSFCTSELQVPIGRPDTSTDVTLQSKSRITITAEDANDSGYVYTSPKKILILAASPTSLSLLVEKRTGANYLNDGPWDTVGSYTLKGYSGWNDIPLVLGTLGAYGVGQTGNNWQLRLTIGVNSLYSSAPKTGAVSAIRLYGDNYGRCPSNMARTGHLYTYDMSQNATFPAYVKINGSKHVGYLTATPTSGQIIVADGADGGIKTSGYTIAKSVPSDAVFTDTKNTAGSTDTSSKIFLIGATSQAANPQTYSHDTAYVDTNGHLYSNSKQVVNLSDSQALTNKTYNGYTLGAACAKGVDTTVTSGSSNLVTSGAVYTAIDNLPEPMVFKGSLGTGGTITTLPTNGSARIGDTYKVITAGTYAGQAAKVGDTFICDSKTSSANTWVLIPSGDEPSGTVTSITIKASSPIAIDSSAAITTSGERTISHANSGVTAGTYRSVTVNATGHVTAGTNPTTLSGYGITDAKIASGTITLGSNTITPLTASSTLDATKLSGTIPSGCYTDTKNTAGSTDTSSKIFLIGATSQAANPQTYSQDTAYVGTDGCLYSGGSKVLTSETDPTVPSWAKASTKPSYNFSEIGAGVATIGDGTNRIMLRTNDGYKSGMYYSTPGNEAMIFAHKNSVTSWMFATADPTAGTSWQSLTPSMQIKNQRVTINKLIANGADASYNLDVNGTINAQTSLTLGGSATLVYTAATKSVDFVFS